MAKADTETGQHIVIHRIKLCSGQRIIELYLSLQVVAQQQMVSQLQIQIPTLRKFHFEAHAKRHSECIILAF